jgi:site-specific recombinase XerD
MSPDSPAALPESAPAAALPPVSLAKPSANPSVNPAPNPAPVTPWHELAAGVASLIQAAKAPNTLRAYRADWQHFSGWCAARTLPALPAAPETIAFYLADLAGQGRKPATLRRKLTALGRAHEAKGFASPASMRHAIVSETLKGIQRTAGVAQTQKEALLTRDLKKVLAELPGGLSGRRDRALLLLGFAGGLRRSELCALNAEDVAQNADGLVLALGRSKTDQEGAGAAIGIPYGSAAAACPVRAYQSWLEHSGLQTGPVFRGIDRFGRLQDKRLHPASVARILKQAAGRAGFDETRFAGHSLRAGFVTQAYLNDASEFDIMRQTRHKSLTTMRRYIRDHTLFRKNAAARLGL